MENKRKTLKFVYTCVRLHNFLNINLEDYSCRMYNKFVPHNLCKKIIDMDNIKIIKKLHIFARQINKQN